MAIISTSVYEKCNYAPLHYVDLLVDILVRRVVDKLVVPVVPVVPVLPIGQWVQFRLLHLSSLCEWDVNVNL